MKNLFENWRNFINEQDSTIQVYCDMDGVIVDFENGVVKYINKDLQDKNRVPENILKYYNKLQETLEDLGRDQEIQLKDITRDPDRRINAVRKYMYARVSDDFEFWRELEWTIDGKDLWDHIKSMKPQVIILTAPMRGEGSRRGKIDWVKNNLGSQYNILLEEDKWKYSGPNRLLIDDTFSKVEPWIQKGGLAVHHQNAPDSITELNEKLNE